MARLVCSVVILVYVLFCFLEGSGALEKPGGSRISEIPLVRNLSVYGAEDYALPGLAHRTAVGAVHHGMKEVEIWLQTIVPDARTPIHRHDCEEVIVTVKGYGTLYIADGHDPDLPGEPQGFPIFPNATLTVPVNFVHQVWNTYEGEDLQIFIVISRPPMELIVYKDWSTPHNKAAVEELKWNILKSPSELEQGKEPDAEDEL